MELKEIAREAAKEVSDRAWSIRTSTLYPKVVEQIILSTLSRVTENAEKELELERMRHAACGVIALSNTRESLAKNREMHPDYLSASVQDCIGMAEREIELRQRAENAEKEKAELRDECHSALAHRDWSIIEDALEKSPDVSAGTVSTPELERFRRTGEIEEHDPNPLVSTPKALPVEAKEEEKNC